MNKMVNQPKDDSFRIFSEGTEGSFFDHREPQAHVIKFHFEPHISESFQRLIESVNENLWWYWQSDLLDLFEELDSDLWRQTNQNASLFLKEVSTERVNTCFKKSENQIIIQNILNRFDLYVSEKKSPQIAYLCMEYGASHVLKNYSGGLGILAGDHLKESSDLNIPLCAFGLAYRNGYFHQQLNLEGRQQSLVEKIDFHQAPWLPVYGTDGKQLKIALALPNDKVWIQCWKVAIGRVDLFLLDTDLPENSNAARKISDQLYSGGSEHRVEQEYVLALGAFEILHKMNLIPQVFHMNEGHTGFMALARIYSYMKAEHLSFDEAHELVRKTTVFTTHTPIPAGHDVFPFEMVLPYLKVFKDQISLDQIQHLSRGLEKGKEDLFSMTGLAARSSYFINGVSKIHAEVSRKMFQVIAPKNHYTEVPVHAITNGVHAPTWVSPELQNLFVRHLGSQWIENQDQAYFWKNFDDVDSGELWETHLISKRKLVNWLKRYVQVKAQREQGLTTADSKTLSLLTEDTLIFTFARRFAPYKRAALLFRDLERVLKIFNGTQPILFLFAGKAHPKDIPGQDLIAKIIEFSKVPELVGKILFVENYEMDIARLLVSGSDVWINNPLRPLEASGTSGMKAAMNGCLNFSVPDGWWAEAYNGENGWAIGTESMVGSLEQQDLTDSQLLYSILENEIIPTFSNRNAAGIPEGWVQRMKKSIQTVLPQFSTTRMLKDYQKMFYNKSIEMNRRLTERNFHFLKAESHSHASLIKNWENIKLIKIQEDESTKSNAHFKKSILFKVELSHPQSLGESIDLQVLVSELGSSNQSKPKILYAKSEKISSTQSLWRVEVSPQYRGDFEISFRVLPKSETKNGYNDLKFNLVKWL